MQSKLLNTIKEYTIITLCIFIMVIGIYIFKFPNNFSFGGVTGYATIVSRIFGISSSGFTAIANMILLLLGFIFLGKKFATKTVYASVMLTIFLELFEKYVNIPLPITDQPLLELIFAILIPGIGSAILFNLSASSGGTDIIAMIIKKYTSWHMGNLLFIVDLIAVVLAFFVFGAQTGLFSLLGLISKSVVIDNVIESVNMCKCFTIICEKPEPICDYIINKLHRSATTYEAQGAFSHHQKTIVLVTMKRFEAIKLRNFIKNTEPDAFMIITSSSEIIGKGFMNL